MLTRRGLLSGLVAAPAVVLTPKLLMPVRSWKEPWQVYEEYALESMGVPPGGTRAIDHDALREHLWPGIIDFFGRGEA